MVTNGEKPQARPLFRKLALGMAVVLFLLAAVSGLAAVFGLVPPDVTYNEKLMFVGICLFMGFVMLTIGRTGRWPPPKR
jgi:hypothetical protein